METCEQKLGLAANDVPPGPGLILGICAGYDASGAPLADYPGNPAGRPVPARSCVALGEQHVGAEVTLGFLDNDPLQPVILGVLTQTRPATPPAEIEISAEGELVLRCGAASIVLTRAGKVLIRGEYVVSQASGVNQINGAAIKLN